MPTSRDDMLDPQRLALGVKHPWAELIIRGIKTLEIRSRPTRVSGRIYIYSSRRPASEDFAQSAVARHHLHLDRLPYGQIIGDVELIGCRRAQPDDAAASCVPEALLEGKYSWILANPRAFRPPLDVRFLPYGVWFYPFQRRSQPPT